MTQHQGRLLLLTVARRPSERLVLRFGSALIDADLLVDLQGCGTGDDVVHLAADSLLLC